MITHKLEFWHSTVFVTYQPNKNDKIGCDGMYVKSVVINSWAYFYFLIKGLFQ